MEYFIIIYVIEIIVEHFLKSFLFNSSNKYNPIIKILAAFGKIQNANPANFFYNKNDSGKSTS